MSGTKIAAFLVWFQEEASHTALLMQVPSTLTHNCSELQAAMLAAVFRHNVVYKDKHVFNFETVYQAFQPLRHAFNPQHRCSKEQAWAAFSSLMNLLLVTTTEKG